MSDNISTNTVFHFTKNAANIESILKNDFYPQFCSEDILGITLNLADGNKLIPMVSFCDIPISQINKHTKQYGEYAIGLTKDWAIKKKINPVIYVYRNSDFLNSMQSALTMLLNAEVKKKKPNDKMVDRFFIALKYIKPYEGRLWRHGKWTKETNRFYDEREWRHVPQLPGHEGVFWINQKGIDDKALRELNKQIADSKKLRLSFEPKDIKFIIVKKESEILPMIDKIITIKRDKFSHKDVQILTTRIISMESIKENI